MRFALISDLHEEFAPLYYPKKLYQHMNRCLINQNVDVLIDAGDSHYEHQHYSDKVDIPSIKVEGNHNFYSRSINEAKIGEFYVIKGIAIAVTTLWMDFNSLDKNTVNTVKNGLSDFALIKDIDEKIIYDIHKTSVCFLKNNPADIIVTHHLPTFKSVDPKYETAGDINYGFASHLDYLIEDLKPVYWCHGHTHSSVNYQFNKHTRIVCNPHGYNNERSSLSSYVPLILDI